MILDEVKTNQRLLIKSDPGSGKSTLLKYVAYTYAKHILDFSQKNLPIPIYVELKWYNDNLIRLILSNFKENGITANEEDIVDWIIKEKFLFLFDGFDELGDKSKNFIIDIKEIIASSKYNKFVITSRDVELLEELKTINFKEKKIKSLSDLQIKSLFEKYLGKKRGNILLNVVNEHDLLNEVRNPLILRLISLEFIIPKENNSYTISINKGELFRNIIENNFLRTWEKKVIRESQNLQKYNDEKVNALSKLAFYMIEEDSLKLNENKVKEIFDSFYKEGWANYKDFTYTILNQLYIHHILVKSGYQVSFWHQSFRDYFVALELVKIYEKNPDIFLKNYISKKWEEPLIFFSGLLNNPSEFINKLIQPFWWYLLKSPSKVSFQLLLAAKCVRASNRINFETQQKLIDRLEKIINEYEFNKEQPIKMLFFPILFEIHNAYRALGITKSEKAAEFLIETLENHDCGWDGCSTCRMIVEALRDIPATALGNTKSKKVSEFLIETLENHVCKAKSGYCGICRWIVEEFRYIPATKNIQISLLNNAFYNADGIVRQDSIEILRESMSIEIASKLVQIILNKNEKSWIRERAIYLLVGPVFSINLVTNHINYSELKHPKIVIDSLIQIALEDEDVSKKAANALVAYKDGDKEEKIINPLIHELLKNSNPYIRANAAYALALNHGKKKFKAFIQALEDKNPMIVSRVAYYLSWGGYTEQERRVASSKLFSLFNIDDVNVRINSIRSYGILCEKPPKEELSLLIDFLKDKDMSIRSFSAEALGRLNAECALNQLKEMVKTEKYRVVWASAIWAILQIDLNFSKVIEENGWEYPYIIMLLNNDLEIETRKYTLEILRKIGTKISLPHLKEINNDHEKKKDIDTELYYAIYDIEQRIGIGS